MRRFNPGLLWVLLAIVTPAGASAQDDKGSGTKSPVTSDRHAAVRSTARNTLVVDHLKLGVASDDLYVLEVADGAYFQVLFENSYPPCFSYSIAATDDAPVESARQVPGRAISVPSDQLSRGRVTMQHREVFSKYRVTAALTCAVASSGTQEKNEGARGRNARPPEGISGLGAGATRTELVELRELSFDMWVRTAPKWTVAINGGVGFHNFKSPQYFVRSGTANGITAKTFEEAEPEAHARPAVMTLISVYPPIRRLRRLGAAVGFGGQGGDLRYYFGGAVSLGGHLVFTGGRAFGFVNAKPLGQEIGQAPTSDNVLADVRNVPASAWYFGFALGFDVKSKPDAISALSALSASKPPVSTPDSAFSGLYATENVLLSVTSEGGGVMVHTGRSTVNLPVRKDNTFTDVAGGQSATFDADENGAATLTLKLTDGEVKASRARSLDTFVGKYGSATAPHVVAIDGSALTLTIPGTPPALVRLTRTGNLTFSGGTHDVVFAVVNDAVSEMTFDRTPPLKRLPHSPD